MPAQNNSQPENNSASPKTDNIQSPPINNQQTPAGGGTENPAKLLHSNNIPITNNSAPPVETTTPANKQAANVSKPPKKAWRKVIILVVIALAIAGGAYGSWFAYQNYFAQTPDKIFWQAWANFELQQKMQVDGSIKISLSNTAKNNPNKNLDIVKNLFTGGNRNSFAADFSTKYDRSAESPISHSKIDISWNNNKIANLEVKQLEKNIFIKPELATSDLLTMFISELQLPDQWIIIDEKSTEELLQNYKPELTEQLDNKNIKIQELVKIIKSNQPFSIEVVDKNDQSLGEAAYLYNLSLIREGFDQTVKDAIKLIDDPERKADLLKEYENLTDDEWNKIKDLKIRIWITKKDQTVRKISLDHTLINETDYPISKIRIQLSLDLQALNKELVVDKPENTITVEEFMENLMKGPREQANNAKRISDIKQIQTALELFYVKNNSYPTAPEGLNLNSSLSFCDPEGFVENKDECRNTVYMNTLPQDPETGSYYYKSVDGQDYEISFSLTQDIGNFKSGQKIATPNGISDAEQILKTTNDVDEKINEEEQLNEEINVDTDEDGLTDDEEKQYGTSYVLQDTDKDGLTDYDEVKQWNTDPTNPDTDADGYSDGEEINNGYNPNGPGKLN